MCIYFEKDEDDDIEDDDVEVVVLADDRNTHEVEDWRRSTVPHR